MSKKPKASGKRTALPVTVRTKAVAQTVGALLRADLYVVLSLLAAARSRAFIAVNTALIDLYWQIGEHISQRIAAGRWGRQPSSSLPNTSVNASQAGWVSPLETFGD